MPGFGWTCAACSFYHNFPGPRCSCCNQLKGATRQEMRDFVSGKLLQKQKQISGGVNENDPIECYDDNDNDNDDDDDDDEIVVIEDPPEQQQTPASSTDGGARNKQQQLNSDTTTTASMRPSIQVPTSSLPAPNQGAAVPRNPYAKKSVSKPSMASCAATAVATAQHNRSGRLSYASTNQHANTSTTIPNKATAPAVTRPADAWQSVSTATATAQAIHPPAPPRQTPGPTPGSLRQQPPQNAFDRLKKAQQSMASSNAHPQAGELSSTNKQNKKSPFTKPPQYSPGPVPFDPETIHDWVYPKSPLYPARQYQQEIAATAVQHNTLVSLPTGLGKTLIASVVMYNFYRWFPTGKIIFLAPTLPLVNQQIEACYKIMGIPASATAVLTGKINQTKRMEHWMSRRVFYCTPQTLQNDLVETDSDGDQVPSIFASQVVCLVLDEAHKATKDYSYVTVIKQLEAANAKFRIVGLSATPGSTIAAIQDVIGHLRSYRLESRDEDDPGIKQHTHDKHMEIVTVPRTNVQKDIERHITNMLDPYLRRLREMNAIYFHGNASISAYHIMKAKTDLLARNQGHLPGHLISLFEAAREIASWRAAACTSLQCLKGKLLSIKNEPQRGIVSTVVKSDEFQQLYQMLHEATTAGGVVGLSQQQDGFTRNNPKLQKLCEVMTEHFHRAAAVEKSSRVIVFSQFRDSVAEIVLKLRTLEPMVRPHHFVGQGKPPKGSANKEVENGEGGGMLRLNGMKQSEQQQVIREFRNDRYNVLVCTCIGEEGLDIGEVDLIINYDTLKSPIRMIQRMGRTGRARAGRVIILLNEGEEEKSYAKSKASSTKLKRALQTKKNLVMVPDVLMFPTCPKERLDMVMNVSSQLHMSQVAGISDKASKRSKGSKGRQFKLDAAEEQERQQRLGNLTVLDMNATPFRSLRRVLIRHRSCHQSFGGRTMNILHALHETYPKAAEKSNVYKALRANSAIHEVFPVEKPPEKETPPHDNGGATFVGNDIRGQLCAQVERVKDQPSLDKESVQPKFMTSKPPAACQSAVGAEDREEPRSTNAAFTPITTGNPSHEQCDSARITSVASTLVQEVSDHAGRIGKGNGKERTLTSEAIESIDPAPEPKFQLPTPPPSSSEEESDDDDNEENVLEGIDSLVGALAAATESPTRAIGQLDNSIDSTARNSSIVEEATVAANTSFCLPTQSSSSEGEESSDNENSLGEGDNVLGRHEVAIAREKFAHQSLIDSGSKPLQMRGGNVEIPEDSDDDLPLISLKTPKKAKNDTLISPRKTPKSKICINRNEKSPASSQMLSGNPAIPAQLNTTETKQLPKSNGNACITGAGDLSLTRNYSHNSTLQDTPTSQNHTMASQQNVISIARNTHSRSDGLTDTPLTAPSFSRSSHLFVDTDKYSCEVCNSLESMDDDPIVLCDGCDLGFHRSCYKIDMSLESAEEWFCDRCASKENSSSDYLCLVCGLSEGAKEKDQNSAWCHPICHPFLESMPLSPRQCSSCTNGGGARCFSCPASIHPYCAINKIQEQCWTIVVVHPQNHDENSSAALFCPKHVDNANNFIVLNTRDGTGDPLPTIRVIQTRKIAQPKHKSAAQPKKLRSKRARNPSLPSQEEALIEDSCCLESFARQARLANMKRRRQAASAFVLEEAEIGSDDDMEGDEDEQQLMDLENDEMSHDSFINDATELSQHFSQDQLAEVDPDASGHIDFNHRAVDARRAIQQQFKTPVFNRRMNRPCDSQFSSSQKGLGNMHFVRSVLEHHRQGGNAEDIEAFYRKMEQGEVSQGQSSDHSPNY